MPAGSYGDRCLQRHLKAVPATGLGAVVIRETVRRSGIDLARIGSVVMGNVIQAGNRMNPARQAGVNGSIPSPCRP